MSEPSRVQAERSSATDAEGVGFEPTRRCYPLRHFECRALDRTMRPLLMGRAMPDRTKYRVPGTLYTREARAWRRERDLNPRGGANPQRHFQCRALDRTMRSLQECPTTAGRTWYWVLGTENSTDQSVTPRIMPGSE